MTRMAAANRDIYDEPPRSIFSSLWFRALLVIVVLGVIAVVAVPYLLDMVNPPVAKQIAVQPAAPPTPPRPSASSPAPAQPPATPEAPPATSAPTPLPDKPVEAAKPAPPARAEPAPAQVAAAKPAVTAPAKAKRPAATGPFWVQVGAFKDQAAAKRLADRLREQDFKVVESVKAGSGTAPASAPSNMPADRYNVFVSGMAPAELTTKLTAKGLAADAVAGGVVIKPSLPLRDAVTLSRELAGEGLRVQVRRAAATTPATTPAKATAGDTFYRVRVGSFPDRAAAQTALKELGAKGYKAYIARGGE
jgi:cell division septation protein DedD